MSEIRTVGVIGAGTMGNGIAPVFARSGYSVRLCEVEQRFLDRGLETIRKNLGREAETPVVTPNAHRIFPLFIMHAGASTAPRLLGMSDVCTHVPAAVTLLPGV